ncbi:MAG: dethiobiotin synthase [Opitutales bacterium]
MKYFITGIDTNIGKTVATGFLANKFKAQGKTVITQKLIQTGCEGISEDIEAHRQAMGIPLQDVDLDGTTCNYVLKFPSSPHLACAMENVDVEVSSIAKNTEKLEALYDVVLLESAGGIMVPLKEDYLSLDYVLEYALPVILVTSSRLGSINHTLLNLELFKLKNIELAGLVYNKYPKEDSLIESSTQEYLKAYLSKHFPAAFFDSLS